MVQIVYHFRKYGNKWNKVNNNNNNNTNDSNNEIFYFILIFFSFSLLDMPVNLNCIARLAWIFVWDR